jgi:hypothetical protein
LQQSLLLLVFSQPHLRTQILTQVLQLGARFQVLGYLVRQINLNLIGKQLMHIRIALHAALVLVVGLKLMRQLMSIQFIV